MTDKDLILKEWNLNGVPSPSYILHTRLLEANLAVIDKVRKEAGVEIIVALKVFCILLLLRFVLLA